MFLNMLMALGMTINPMSSIEKEIDCKNERIDVNFRRQGDEYNSNSLAYGDVYEVNDNFDQAENLSPDDYYCIDSYQKEIEATLDYSGYEDRDFYYFKLLSESNVEICINPNNPNQQFDFYLLTYDFNDIHDCKRTLNDYNYFVSRACTSSTQEYSGVLQAGTYFIILKGLEKSNIEYSLYLNVSKTCGYPTLDVVDAKINKDLGGVIWFSDFMPVNYYSISDIQNDVMVYKRNETNLQYPDYALDDMLSISEGEPIKLATYYIWDPEIRYVLFLAFDYISNVLWEQMKNEEQKVMDLTLERDVVAGTVSLVGTVASLFPVSKVWTIGTKILSKVSSSIINSIFNSLMPKITYDDAFFLAYISALTTALNPGIDVEDIGDPDKIEVIENNLKNFDDNKIIQIPIYYTIYSDYSDLCLKKYVSFRSTYSSISQSNYFEYTKTEIPSSFTDDFNCRGKFYAIEDDTDVFNPINMRLTKDVEYVTPEVEEVYLNDDVAFSSFKTGEYVWCVFNVPTTKKYYFVAKQVGNIYIELFHSLQLGYSSSDLIISKTGGYINKNNSEKKGCYFLLELEKGKTIYIRIRNKDYLPTNDAVIFCVSDVPDSTAVHIHDYEVSWLNSKQHYLTCECGTRIKQVHAVDSSNPGICCICGGPASTAVINRYKLTGTELDCCDFELINLKNEFGEIVQYIYDPKNLKFYIE